MTTPPNSLPDWLVAVLASGLTALVAWARARKKEAKDLAKASAEVELAELENVEKAITIWRQLADEMIKQVDHLKKEVMDLTAQVKILHTENGTLRDQVERMKQENRKLEHKVEQIKGK